jgi:general secretion pathway protein G
MGVQGAGTIVRLDIKRTSRCHTNFSEAGFTLLELLVVLGIIAMLAALVAPQVLRYLGDARSSTANAQLQNIASAVELYYLDNGSYPPSDAGLTALVTAPAALAGWKGPYLKKKEGIVDPWGRSFLYKSPGDHGAYDISTLGRDGKAGGDGENKDLASW